MSCGKKTRHTKAIGCCPICHELFSGDTAFEKHRTTLDGDGRRNCTAPTEAGLIARPSKSAPDEVIWGSPAPANQPDAWRKS